MTQEQELKKTLMKIKEANPSCIIAICYNTAMVYSSKTTAKKFFKEGMIVCDGSEAERYANIYLKLDFGMSIANDSDDWNKDQLTNTIVREISYKGKIKSPNAK